MKTIKMIVFGLVMVGLLQTNCLAISIDSIKAQAAKVATSVRNFGEEAREVAGFFLTDMKFSPKKALAWSALATGPLVLDWMMNYRMSVGGEVAYLAYMSFMLYTHGFVDAWNTKDESKSAKYQKLKQEAFENKLFLGWVGVNYPAMLARLKRGHCKHLDKFIAHPDEFIWLKPATAVSAKYEAGV